MRSGCSYGEHTSSTSASVANGQFDTAKNNGGLYVTYIHPAATGNEPMWNAGSAYSQHLAYISRRNDVWYAPLGQIMAYRYVALNVQYTTVNVMSVRGD